MTYLPYFTTYLPTYLPTGLFTCLLQPTTFCTYLTIAIQKPTYFRIYLPTTTFSITHPPMYWFIDLPTHPPTSLLIYLPIGRPPISSPIHPRYLLITYLPIYLFSYPPIHPPTSYNIPTYVFHNLVMMCRNKYVK